VALAQTAASLSSDNFDDQIIKRISEPAGAPAITLARAIGLAVQALGARRIALVTPFPVPLLRRLASYYTGKFWLEGMASGTGAGACACACASNVQTTSAAAPANHNARFDMTASSWL